MIVPYIVFAVLWILLSDLAVETLISNPESRTSVSIFKGFGFIFITAFLLYALQSVESRARFKAEERMRVAQLKYETVFKNSPDFICIISRDGVILDANAAFIAVFNRPGGVIGRRFDDMAISAIPGDKERYFAALQEGKGSVNNFRTRMMLTNGESRDFLVSGFLMNMGDEEVLFTSGHDITEIQRAESALRETEEEIKKQKIWLERAERVGKIGGWSIDLKTGEVWASEQACEIYGLPMEGYFTLEDIRGIPLPEYRGTLDRALKGLTGGVTPYDLEFKIKRRTDGRILDLHSVAEYDAGIQTVFGVIQDISARKEVERKSSELATLLDIANDAVYVRSLDHTLLYWNKGAESLYGWTLEEALGQFTTELFSKDLSATESVQEEILKTGSWSGERTHRTRKGVSVIVFARLTLVRDASGAPQAVLAINTDITEKKRLESHLLRTQRLESLGALSSGIAHDLNNVLAPILMSVSLLKDEVHSPSGKQILATIEASAQRGSEVVKQVLTFARGAKGERIVLQPEHLVRETFKIVRETFPRNIRIALNEAPDIWPIKADGTQVHQAIMNLCVNARDALTDGGTVTLGLRNIEVGDEIIPSAGKKTNGPHVCLRVSDTGSGIPPEVMDKIFEPFFTTKPTGQGTGLGLPTVLGIVRGHGGFVRIQTCLGAGSHFELYFPAQKNATVDAPVMREPAVPKGQGQCILLVDDEQAVREIIKRAIEMHGYKCILAAEGSEAVSLYIEKRENIALVITDMMMPIMDGASLIKILRRVHPHLPIIGMSGVGDLSTLKDLDALHLDAFLGKPCSTPDLLRTIHGVLSHDELRKRNDA